MLILSLRGRLALFFFLGAVLSIAVVAAVSFQYSESILEENILDHLSRLRQIKMRQIYQYFQERREQIRVLAASSNVKQALSLLRAHQQSNGATSEENFPVAGDKYAALYKQINPFFHSYIQTYNYADLWLIGAESGQVMYSACRNNDLGSNLRRSTLKNSALAQVWQHVQEQQRLVLADFSDYAPRGKPTAFIATTVRDDKDHFQGVLVLGIRQKEINELVQESARMGKTGEIYVVGEELLMRSDSRFSEQSTILRQKVDSVAVRRAFSGVSGAETLTDYRGATVLSSYGPLQMKQKCHADFEWVLLAEMDVREALAPVTTLKWQILWLGLLIALLAASFGYVSARGLARPIEAMVGKIERMADGDLSVTLPASNRTDEVGVLLHSFQKLQSTLRQQTQQIKEGTNTLASATSEISVSMAQFTSSATEAATAVNQTTTTVEEVKQTARLTKDKAHYVSGSSQKVAEIAASGSQAVSKSISGMNNIKEQMTAIADTILKLSEQSQSIGEIIVSVSDLAEQSNLLAVNAAIEAAKAGEEGRGFAVVAREIKNLAEQSKQATHQVRIMLGDIQRATGEAVVIMDKGNQAVASGVEQSLEAGEAIAKLAESIEEAAQAARQIAASAQQQVVGMDQVVIAMDSIKQSSVQNVESSRQLQTAARNIAEMGDILKNLVARFKV